MSSQILKMQALSRWAKHHHWQARILIGLSHTILVLIGIWYGRLILEVNFHFHFLWLVLGCVLTGILFIGYPLKKYRVLYHGNHFYVKQKKFDLAIVVTGFCMFIMISNRGFDDVMSAPSLFAISGQEGILTREKYEASLRQDPCGMEVYKEHLNKGERKIFKANIKEIKHSTDLSRGAKIFLIFLTLLVAFGLFIGLASWACSLSCSGYEAAASTVLIIGIPILLGLTIFVISRIVRKKKQVKVVST